jgi:hypothetical protein
MANGNSGPVVTGRQIAELLKRQQYRCAYTGDDLTPDTASLDHVVPLQRGGEHAIANMAVVRHDVNMAKGTMTRDEFLSMCRAVVAHADDGGENTVIEDRGDTTQDANLFDGHDDILPCNRPSGLGMTP